MDKERDSSKPIDQQVKMIMPNIHVKGKTVILLDDIISSGTTIINAALLLKSRKAKKVFVGCVYGEFTHGIKIFRSKKMRLKQIEQLKRLGQLNSKQIKYLEKRKRMIDGLVSTDIMANRSSRVSVSGVISRILDNLKISNHMLLKKGAIERQFYKITIDEMGNIIKTFEEKESDLYNKQYIIDALGQLVKGYGSGILEGIREIEVVDRDGYVGSQQDSKIKIDIDIFRNKNLVVEVIEHEALYKILRLIIPDNPNLAEVLAMWYSVKRFSKLLSHEQTAIIELLLDKSNGLDPSGKYAEFLKEIKGKKLKGDTLIKLVMDYTAVKDVNLAEVKEAEKRLKEILKLFNDIARTNVLCTDTLEAQGSWKDENRKDEIKDVFDAIYGSIIQLDKSA